MKNYYSAVVEYVKNLFPGRAPVEPSDNPKLDAEVLASLATDVFFTTARNGGRYWYCFTRVCDRSVAKYILASNGIDPSLHKSRFYYEPTPVLRVRMSKLNNNMAARKFVENVMDADTSNVDKVRINARIAEIKQRMK